MLEQLWTSVAKYMLVRVGERLDIRGVGHSVISLCLGVVATREATIATCGIQVVQLRKSANMQSSIRAESSGMIWRAFCERDGG